MEQVYDAVAKAAVAAYEWVGKGDKLAADKAATDTLREELNKIDMLAKVEIGEYEKDKSFGLNFNEYLGCGKSQFVMGAKEPFYRYGIAVDPLECTSQIAKGGPGAACILALGPKGTFYSSREHYMFKLVIKYPLVSYLKNHPGLLGIRKDDYESLLKLSSNVLGRPVRVCTLDRPRHNSIVDLVENTNSELVLIEDGDVMACLDTESDIYMGIGGVTEGVLAAAGLRALGDNLTVMSCIECTKDWEPVNDGVVLLREDLVKNDCSFYAVGVTDGSLLGGVKKFKTAVESYGLYANSFTKSYKKILTLHNE